MLSLCEERPPPSLFDAVENRRPRESGEAGIFTTETRRHGEQQHLLKRRGMKEAMRLPILPKAAKGWATRALRGKLRTDQSEERCGIMLVLRFTDFQLLKSLLHGWYFLNKFVNSSIVIKGQPDKFLPDCLISRFLFEFTQNEGLVF